MIKLPFQFVKTFFLHASGKQKMFTLLFMLSSFSCFLFIMRALKTDDLYYGFLAWNLFLAWLPLVFSVWAHRLYFQREKKWLSLLPSFLWLIFFPNAPYIITDLVHLKSSFQIPMWYDSLLVFSFALTGLVVGFSSLFLIHRIIETRFGNTRGWIMIFILCVASGYGIYVGRILRWNSWDLIINTFPLFSDMAEHFLTTTSLVMTSTFSFFIAISYLLLHFIVRFPIKSL